MTVFNNYLYKNKKPTLCFGDRVAVINDLFYGYRGSNIVKFYNFDQQYLFNKLVN
jgi:hypothetical protein